MSRQLVHFLDGALMVGFAVSALFFLRFWRETRDRLFLLFAAGFLILSVNRIALTWFERGPAPHEETREIVYLMRLLAFVLILGAIIDKNRRPRAFDRGPS